MSLFLNKSNLTAPPRFPLTKVGQREGAGFTLIEVLISVAILSVILAAIYSTFFLSQKAVDGMDESMLKLQEARKAIDILRRELDSAVYYDVDKYTLFKIMDRDIYGKQAAQLTFTTFSPLRPGLSRISYYMEEKEGKINLLKKMESSYIDEETEGIDIIEGLEAFTVEAMYNDIWVRTWDTDINKSMPYEIKISLTIAIKGEKVTLFDISRPKAERPV
jgi:prepilin-type N-terminal cleavage/methylation domain-containing protein